MSKNIDKLKLLVPMEEIEQGAQKQIYDILQLDFVKALAIMPDVHQGYDMPIGGVALTDNYISPSWVGFDIGCGVTYVNTYYHLDSLFSQKPTERTKQLIDLMNKIYEVVPTGVGRGRTNLKNSYPCEFRASDGDKNFEQAVSTKIQEQYGTLGSGNHFIELGFNKNNQLCVIIHSGSRKPGWLIAQHYMRKGRFFEFNSQDGREYWQDMNYALNFALANRKTMMVDVLKAIGLTAWDIKQSSKTLINENHNHAIRIPEGILHRKGATPAKSNQLGIIPISMGHGSYLTIGLGNKEYLESASHGAGRVKSRSTAKKTITMEEFKNSMGNIVAPITSSILDEAPQAYKDADYILRNQEGIVVDIIDYITPLIEIKGDADEEK